MDDHSAILAELGIPAADWEQTPASVRMVLLALYHQVQRQNERIAALEAEVADLREKLDLHSGNSSLPPSSDGPKEKAKRKPKKKRRRKRGGQKGHPGHTRHLLSLEEVDEVVVHQPAACTGCGSLLLGQDPDPYRYQVTEIPPVQPVVTEHQVHTVTCACCGQTNKGELPPEIAVSQFGPNLTAMVALMMGVYRLSKRQVVRLLQDVYDVQMSPGSVVNIQNRVSTALEKPTVDALAYVKAGLICHMDETGWKQGDADRSAWLWVGVTTLVTVFQIALSRGSQVVKVLIEENGESIVCSDRHSAYNWLDPDRRQVCWAHLLRNFQRIADRDGPSAEIGEALLTLGYEILERWGRVRDETLTRHQFLDQHLPTYRRAVRLWLEQGAQCSHAKTARTCQKILTVEPALWTFASVDGLEPTNNSAERALRHAVIWRKICQGTQSAAGSRFVERILTTIETCRQQQRSPLDFIRQAVIAHWSGQTAPSLLPS